MKLWFTLTSLVVSVTVQAGITIGSYNIRNFDYDERSKVHTNKSELAVVLRALNADVLSLNEVNNTAEFRRFVAAKMPGYNTELSRCGGEHGQRLGFLYNESKVEMISFTEDTVISDPANPHSCETGSRPLAIEL